MARVESTGRQDENSLLLVLEDEAQTLALGRDLAPAVRSGGVVFLQGALGMGKTTLARGLLNALGYQGKVKSPTYTIVEPYELESVNLYHFDLYRLEDPQEVELMGAREYFCPENLCLVEWPCRGQGWIPAADLELVFERHGHGRQLRMLAGTEKGREMLNQVKGKVQPSQVRECTS